MKRAFVVPLPLLFVPSAIAQRNFDNVQVSVAKVQGNIYVLTGAGGNTTVRARTRTHRDEGRTRCVSRHVGRYQESSAGTGYKGMILDQVKAAKPTAKYGPPYGGPQGNTNNVLGDVCEDLTKKR